MQMSFSVGSILTLAAPRDDGRKLKLPLSGKHPDVTELATRAHEHKPVPRDRPRPPCLRRGSGQNGGQFKPIS
jgi:hypothetical protein